MATKIEIPEQITVGALAEQLQIPVSKLIGELFKNGVMATVNEKIDYDTAQIVLGEMEDLDVELVKKEHEPATARPKREVSAKATSRPPVIAVMGHVDHGKTSLLDAIRDAEVVKGEAGGITQHLSAYQISHKGRQLTFIDTPGHEAFAALREHGARLTDLVVLVVAADEGIKPQTLEAVRFAKAANVKIIVAANKMDKATEAQFNQLKAQLAENGLMPEDFGGDTIILPVSAKTKDGLPELLDMVVLVADVEELKADNEGPAQGIIIESHMETGRGRVAVALVEQGVLSPGDFVVAGNTYAKVRNLETTSGEAIKSAGPSTPVIITGLKDLPDFGEEFEAVASEKIAKDRSLANSRAKSDGGFANASSGSELLKTIDRTKNLSEFNVLLKADVQGSLTSVTDSLKGLNTDEVAVKIVGSSVGALSENDIHLAATTGSIIYGFHTSLPSAIKQLAQRDHVSVRLYSVIYELIEDVRKELENLLSPEIIEENLGELTVKGVFKITKNEVICGGEVTKGTLKVPSLANVKRGKEIVAQNLEIISLKRGPQEVKEVPKGEMCGLSFRSESRVEVHEEDKIELFSRESKQRTL